MPYALDDQSNKDWSLSKWLNFLESIHPKNIDMGLSRVAEVANRLDLSFADCKVVTVAGTNGKGSTCAVVEQALRYKAINVGVYSSPHLLDYKERVRINGAELCEQQHCAAFLAVEEARQQTSLTYFEFGTLAALYLLSKARLDVVLLEVGLGGRLDAVNILDADIAVITSIDLDHQAWLGDTREKIGFEKAGIFRENIAVVVGDPNPPVSIEQRAIALKCRVVWQGADFKAVQYDGYWQWQSSAKKYQHLPTPHVPILNASTAIAVLDQLDLDFSQQDIADLITQARLPGRLQQISSSPRVLLDVAHNRQACKYLAEQIQQREYAKLFLVCGMLADKDVKASLCNFHRLKPIWCLAELDSPRSASLSALQSVLVEDAEQKVFNSIEEAYKFSLSQAQANDLIVVFGSFYSVAEVLCTIEETKEK